MTDAFAPDAALLPLLPPERRAAFLEPAELESPARRNCCRKVRDSARPTATAKPTE